MTKIKTKKSLINIFLTEMNKIDKKNFQDLHTSVLLHELVANIHIKKQEQNIIVDATLGMGGHAREVLKKLKKGDVFIGFDADIRNLNIVKPELEKEFAETGIRLLFINDNFKNLRKRLEENNIEKITGIYYDLGISSLHVDEAERGFSFKLDGPLDMRFDTNSGITASQILHNYTKDDLVKIFREYGEEPSARKVAEEIVLQRKSGQKFMTTVQLSDLIMKVSKFPKTKTRIFQALRIEVNKELEVIETSLQDAITLLDSKGSIFVISFHSLEDRIVKNIFKNESKDCICNDLICMCHHTKQLHIQTKKPILPTAEEVRVNQRSRSAKARCAVKI